MHLPVILIIVGVFTAAAISQVLTFKTFLKRRREEYKK